MNAADLLHTLGLATLAASVALVLAMLLPRLLRRVLGAGNAYALWWLVPAAVLAALLPARVVDTVPVARAVPTVSPTVLPGTPVTTDATVDSALLWLGVWIAGALGMALLLAWRQSRFVRALGPLSREAEDLWRSREVHGLPALLGVLAARIVLPADFESHYAARERALMLAHERFHRRRGDPLANFGVALLRCVFWFNPLVHLAARSFRHDQELACDQAVIAAHPDSRRAYGEAMLKTLMADRQAPLGCHWGFSHPLKERVMQLKNPIPHATARRFGVAAVALLVLGGGFVVWSAQPARYRAVPVVAHAETGDTGVLFENVVSRDGNVISRPRVLTAFGEPAAFEIDGAVRVEMEADPMVGDRSTVRASFFYNDNGTWKPDVSRHDDGTMTMVAQLSGTPSFERTMAHGGYRVVVMPRRSTLVAPPAPPSPPTPPSPPAPLAPLAALDVTAPLAPLEQPEAPEPPAMPPEPPSFEDAPEPPTPPAPPTPPHAMARPAPAPVAFASVARAEASAQRAEAHARAAEQRAMEEAQRARAEQDEAARVARQAGQKAAQAAVSARAAQQAAMREASLSARDAELQAAEAAREARVSRAQATAAAAEAQRAERLRADAARDERRSFVRTSAPVYPEQAKAQGKSGVVVLDLLVAQDGRVHDVKVASSTPAGVFDAAAIAAARNWTLSPAQAGAKPEWVQVPISFEAGDAVSSSARH